MTRKPACAQAFLIFRILLGCLHYFFLLLESNQVLKKFQL